MLYLGKPVCENSDCVEAFSIWWSFNQVHSYFLEGTMPCWHWCKRCLPALPICLTLLKLDTSCYISCHIFWPLILCKLLKTSYSFRCLLQCPATWLLWYWCSTSNLFSCNTTQRALVFYHVGTAIPYRSTSCTSSSSLTSSFFTSSNCPWLKRSVSIQDFSFSERLDRPSGLPILHPSL